MNSYVRSILTEFKSRENVEYLGRALSMAFRDARVDAFLSDNIASMVCHFATTYERQMSVSLPFGDCGIYDQINALNSQFLEDRAKFIKAHVLCNTEIPTSYTVRDSDIPTSRNNLAHYQAPADDILATWRRNSGRGMQAREDSHNDHVSQPSQYYASAKGAMRTGITFCDQSNIGLIEGSELIYSDKMFNILNDTAHQRLWGNHFGAADNDERLLKRRIFRKNEQGIENGIPVYEQRLYRRNLDRDIRENMPGDERGCMIRAHDMSTLFDRVDKRRQYAAKHPSRPWVH